MDQFNDLKQQELNYLAGIYRDQPELFDRPEDIETPDTLNELGIVIPGWDKLPSGIIKFLASDFLVEEVDNDGRILTVDHLPPTQNEQLSDQTARTVYATLVKCQITTLEAMEDLAKQLNCDTKKIQYAGLKDKAAITAQRISIRDQSPQAVGRVISPNYFLKDIVADKGAVAKGHLQGNRFTILIRTTGEPNDHEQAAIESAAEAIDLHGFYNYYYLQRFATPRLINYLWGALTLQGRYKEALESVLTTTNGRELPLIRQLRKRMQGQMGDWRSMLELTEPLPLILDQERQILRHLIDHPQDHLGALQTLPDQVTLWLYGFSSWLFNQKLSGYLLNNQPLPANLPLFLSWNKKDQLPYQNWLSKINCWPPPFSHLKPFQQYIQLRSRTVPTTLQADIDQLRLIPEGFVIRFTLPKGAYATTFLAHLFNPAGGYDHLSGDTVNLPGLLDGRSNDTLNYFQDLIRPRSHNILEEIANR